MGKRPPPVRTRQRRLENQTTLVAIARRQGRMLFDSQIVTSSCAADLRSADFEESIIHQASGLPSNLESLTEWFQRLNTGSYLVFRSFDESTPHSNDRPSNWILRSGSYIEEKDVCRDRRVDAGSGINFGTYKWVSEEYGPDNIWACLIHHSDTNSVVMQYGTDGKGRCARLKLLFPVWFK